MTTHSTTAYLDCFSGISGDMLLAAFIHAGLDKEELLTNLHTLKDMDFQLDVQDQICSGISCKQLRVHSPSKQHFRHLGDILSLLNSSDLPSTIISKACRIFTRLAQAEAKVHRVALDKIHFHEVGAVDTIVDIVGALTGMDRLGITKLVCSPLPMGSGFVRCAHGNLPLPAPAVYELLTDVPVYGVDQEKELVTPTGAVLAVELASGFSAMPAMAIKQIGYGCGSHTLNNDQPNLLRVIVGTEISAQECSKVEVIETNLDDWNSEGFPYLCDLLFEAGALDVSLSPLVMKKGRPGQLLRVITDSAHGLAIKQIILSETTAIGLRFRQEERITLAREAVMVSTPWGEVTAKKVATPQGIVIYPEYEACKDVAREQKIPLARVYQAVSKNVSAP